jgi:hypothetical protein
MDPVLDACGCCEGLKDQTPVSIVNLPGLSAIAYRIGTHGRFKAAMISGLSGDPVLTKLAARDEGDPSIALIDAWAAVLDVLTFYQERIAQEGYLRTATERCSIIELARSIGYRLKPGVAASTYLAFELETATAPGSPQSVRIDAGTRAQSIPGQDETPQIFETVDSIEARPELNKLLPQMTVAQSIYLGQPMIYLKGISTQLQPGDAIVILGSARIGSSQSEEWDLRIIKAIKTDADKNQTIVTFDRSLGTTVPKITYPAKYPDKDDPKVFAFRQRASLFGYNAPDFLSMPGSYITEGKGDANGWKDFRIRTAPDMAIDLDRVYPKIVKDSWIVLISPNEVELYRVNWAKAMGREDFGLTGSVSHLILDSKEHLHNFGLRDTVVLAQSEELFLDDIPYTKRAKGTPAENIELVGDALTPVGGAQIELDRTVKWLQQGRAILVSGKRIRAKLTENIAFPGLKKDKILQIMKSPESLIGKLKWQLRDSSGADVSVDLDPGSSMKMMSAFEDDEIVTEAVHIIDSSIDPSGHTILRLEKSLKNIYDRKTVAIYANVAPATNGASTEEVLGQGDASQPFQKFILNQSPLTYVQSTTPGGGVNTLKILVNGVMWKEVPSLHGLDGREQVYITRIWDDGRTLVQFGDGITGSRLPTGSEVKAMYRKGTGLTGLVRANQVMLLMTRPLGVKGVNNPGRSEGAEDPEPRDQARRNAPFTVMTFDRVVSLRDYEDFARNFLGVGKAQAAWLWSDGKRVIHITVAAAGGGPIGPSSDLINNLRKAIANAGDPRQTVRIDPYSPSYFGVDARVLIDQGCYSPEKVLATVRKALEDEFSFERRMFGQDVEESDILALIQGVEGVLAANLEIPVPAKVDATGLLMIDPKRIVLKEMGP